MRLLFSLSCAWLLLDAAARTVCTSAGDLTAALRDTHTADETFALTATVSSISTSIAYPAVNIAFADTSGSSLCNTKDRRPLTDFPRPGARALLRGFVEKDHCNRKFAVLTNYAEIAFERPPKPVTLTRNELISGNHDFTLCKINGNLRDVTINESNPYWIFLSVAADHGNIFASVPISTANDLASLETAIGSPVTLTGIVVPYDHGLRAQAGCIFKIPSMAAIEVRGDGEKDAAAIPLINSIRSTHPNDIPLLGRHRARGHVLAVSRSGESLLKSEDNELIGLTFAKNIPLPRFGDHIEAIGLPDTDLFRINLRYANWKKLDDARLKPPSAPRVSPETITNRKFPGPFINYAFHGKSITLIGTVRRIPNETDERLYLDCDRYLVPVDASLTADAFNAITVGSTLSVSGTCIMDIDALHYSSTIPRVIGFHLVVRTPEDVRILSQPSWWTSGRLMTLCGILLALLIGFLAWNAILRRIVERRGHELAAATINSVTSALKTRERTRLAVELHDSLAQNLTAISLEIDTAGRLAAVNAAGMHEHLSTASSALKSCRQELRNCLWDLRHETLDYPDMESAVRDTLKPHLGTTVLRLRFKVPRDILSDNATHAILRIIRELTLNAVRHGKATEVHVAGCVEDNRLLFSVSDNGCGFDPKNYPDDTTGHYGLLGIRERINTFEGQLQVESRPGGGSRIAISINLPHEQT